MNNEEEIREILMPCELVKDLEDQVVNQIQDLLKAQDKIAREDEREKIWKWAVENGITDKKSFVALRDFISSLIN